MSAKVGLFAVAFAIVLLPWLVWLWQPVRRVAPLAVVQILAGVALGPSLLGRLAPEWHGTLFSRPVLDLLDGVAAIGVVLYVFVTGLHLDLGALRADGARLGGIALGSIAVPLGFGAAAGWWIGGDAGFVAAVAICVAVTALPVLAAILREMGLLGTRLGQTALAVAALNDLALWLMLAVLLAVSQNGAPGLAWLAVAAAWAAALLLGLRPVLARLDLGGQAALVVGAGLAVLSAAVSEFCGTGYLIGAFLAGLAMPQACRQSLLDRLELVTATVLLPFFFMSTGLKALIQPGDGTFLLVFAAATVATMVGKLLGTALPARLAGWSWAESLSLGVMMQTKGLMEVVVLSVLHGAGLIGTGVFSALVSMAVVCTVVTAPLVRALRSAAPARAAVPARP